MNVFGNVGQVVLRECASLLKHDHELLGGGQVWNVQHSSESGHHLHVLYDLAPAAGADNKQLPAFGWLFLEQHQKCLQREIRVPRANGTVVQQALDVIDENAAQNRSVGIVKDLSTQKVKLRCKRLGCEVSPFESTDTWPIPWNQPSPPGCKLW